MWDISLFQKYRTDIFFRTTCHIITTQVVLTAAIIAILWLAMGYLSTYTSETLITHFSGILQGNKYTPEMLTQEIHEIRVGQFQPIALAISFILICAGLVMAHVALTPTRRSFERQKRFISNIAHELRTPLSIIRTNTDVALMSNNTNTESRKVLRSTITELERITEIINNLMTLSNLIRREHIVFKEVDLSKIVKNAMQALKEVSTINNVTLQLRKDTEATVMGNASALEQVAFNLIKNALSHTGSGGLITVTISQSHGDYVDLTVSDTGEGIDSKDLFHIFEPFYRTRNSVKHQGTGLGLTIVNEIVQMHRGKITIRSTRHRGTSVIVSIPLSYQHGGAEIGEEERVKQSAGEVSMDFSRTLLD